MMALLFKVKDDRFGLNVVNIVEVIPSVSLQKIPRAPAYVAGLLNYRGAVVPVVDLGQLIDCQPVRVCLSSRIILVKTENSGRVGLLAEGVTETIKVDDADFTNTKMDSDMGWLVDKVAIDSEGMIQHINPDVIVPDELNKMMEDGHICALAPEDVSNAQ